MQTRRYRIRWKSILNGTLLSFIMLAFFQNCAPPQKIEALALDKEFAINE